MAQNTPVSALPWPELTDIPNAQTAVKNLADALDTKVIPKFANATARDAAITSPVEGMMIYRTDIHGFQQYNGSWLPNGITVCTSSTRPSSPETGRHIYETDTKRHYVWIGSAWYWPLPRGAVGGTRYTGTGNLAATISAETLANMDTGTVALEAGRQFIVKARFKITYASGVTQVIMRLRDGVLAGTQIGETVLDAANITAGHTFGFEADFDTASSGAVSKKFVLTCASSGSTSTISGPGTTNPTYVEIHDVGPSGLITVQNTP
jgi:hypothetical protein